MSKTYRTTLVKFVHSIYGEANALNIMQTRKLTYDSLAQHYIDELAKHGFKVSDLQNTIHRLNKTYPTATPPHEKAVLSLENWMRKVMRERWNATNR